MDKSWSLTSTAAQVQSHRTQQAMLAGLELDINRRSSTISSEYPMSNITLELDINRRSSTINLKVPIATISAGA